MKYGKLNLGQIEALVNKLGGMEGVEKFLRGELIVSELTLKWREENGVIYFSVESDGTTGEDWITRLESKGFRVSDYAKQVLRTPSFKPTNGVTTEVAVLKGMLFEDNDRITKKIRAYAEAFKAPGKRKLSKPNAELACLIREKFTDKEIEAMGLIWIVAMHEPINDSGGAPHLLSASRTTMVAGSTRATTGLAAGGVVTAGSRSPCRKLVLITKILGTSVPLALALSPVPIRRSRAKFFHINRIFLDCKNP